ncbi:MAG: DUF2273 domain-containing protein [Fusobacteriaceae bacterium]
MLEEFITDFLENRKRYFRCIIAFILALIFVEYGFVKMIFILLVSFLGYVSGAPNFVGTLKKLYNEKNNN